MIRRRTALPVAVLVLAGVGAGAGSYAAVNGGGRTTTIVQQLAPATPAARAVATSGLSIHQIYERAYPAVVEITGTQHTTADTPFGAQTQKDEVQGSGFVYDTLGHVVTNYHVVRGTTSTQVTFADGSTYPASVVGFDPSTDLAVLKVDAPAGKLRPLALGDSERMQVGDAVVAIGAPFGLPETVTNGIVSALDRTISSDNAFSISGAIQTDAPINHGNSGGPLLNARGQVIGVNSQIESEGGGSDGVGFAISSNTVRSVITQLLRTGKVEHAYLGVSIEAPPNGNGAQLASVKRNSPAARAGLKHGDVITRFDGRRILGPNALIGAVNAKRPGDTVTVTYRRGGRTHTTQLTLGNRPS